MAVNISGLVNNISGGISNLLDQFLGNSKGLGLYPPGFDPIVPEILPENWIKLPQAYSFEVIDVSQGNAGSSGGFKEFPLPLAPTAINQSENFAISIKATQGGTVVTHSGNKYKDLIIEGTTGIAPFRGTGGVDKVTGQGIFQPSDLKYRSGYEVFLNLRNYFKTYYQLKKENSELSKGLRLTFKNYKDGEFLIVELLKFNMIRQAARSHLYDYKLEFKVIKHFEFEKPELSFLEQLDNLLNTAISKIDLARGVFLRTQGILRQVESTYNAIVIDPLRKIGLAAKAFRGIGLVASDISDRIIRNTVNEFNNTAILLGVKDLQDQNRREGGVDQKIVDVTLPNDISGAVSTRGTKTITDLGEALTVIPITVFPQATIDATNEEVEESTTLPRSFYTQTRESLKRVSNNAEDLFNLNSEDLDEIFNRTSTLQADEAKEITDEEFDVLDAFNQAITAIDNLTSSDTLFKRDFNAQLEGLFTNFDDLAEFQSLPATRQVIVNRGDTLERIAQRELNNSVRWVEIAELNNLKYPYVVEDFTNTQSNIVRPGDTILVPQAIVDGFSNAPKGAENPISSNFSELEKSFGIDIRLDKNFDLALGANQDIQLVGSSDNMTQAILLKLFYEQGEVMSAPGLGVGLIVGSKLGDLQDLRRAIINSLNQDIRIERVTDLNIRRNGPEVNIAFNIFVKRVDIPIPVKLSI